MSRGRLELNRVSIIQSYMTYLGSHRMGLPPGIKFSAALVYIWVEWGTVTIVFPGSQHNDPNEGLVPDLSIVRRARVGTFLSLS